MGFYLDKKAGQLKVSEIFLSSNPQVNSFPCLRWRQPLQTSHCKALLQLASFAQAETPRKSVLTIISGGSSSITAALLALGSAIMGVAIYEPKLLPKNA